MQTIKIALAAISIMLLLSAFQVKAQQWFVLDNSKLIEVTGKGITAYNFTLNQKIQKLNTVSFKELGMNDEQENFPVIVNKIKQSYRLHHSFLEGFLEISFSPKMQVKGKIVGKRSAYLISANYQAPDDLKTFPVPLYNENWLSPNLKNTPHSIGRLFSETNTIAETAGKSFSLNTLKNVDRKKAFHQTPSLLYVNEGLSMLYALQNDSLYLFSNTNFQELTKISIAGEIIGREKPYTNVKKYLYTNNNKLFLIVEEQDMPAQVYMFTLQNYAGKPIATLPNGFYPLGFRNGNLYYFNNLKNDKVVRALLLQ